MNNTTNKIINVGVDSFYTVGINTKIPFGVKGRWEVWFKPTGMIRQLEATFTTRYAAEEYAEFKAVGKRYG